MYIEPKVSSLDILQSDNFLSDKIIILHPFQMRIILKTRKDAKTNQQIKIWEINIPLIEFEISLKQVFMIKSIIDKLQEETLPLISLIKHSINSGKKEDDNKLS